MSRCRGSASLAEVRAAGPELTQNGGVAAGPANGRDVGVVLRGGAQQCRAADVDQLDGLLLAHAAPGGRSEGIKVDSDELERLDPVLVECGDVLGTVGAREDRCVDARVERLHTAAEQLRDGSR